MNIKLKSVKKRLSDKATVLRLARYIGITALELKDRRVTTDNTISRVYKGSKGQIEITKSTEYRRFDFHMWPGKSTTIYMNLYQSKYKLRVIGRMLRRLIKRNGGLGEKL